MSRLEWDKLSKRFYETGIDRGVLYLADNTGVAWNGLTAIQENKSDMSTEPIYFFGEKVNNSQSFGDYSATLNAYTYPDEFEELEGQVSLGDGLSVTNQPINNRFGLCYRTRIGNDVDGYEHGYKLHILYNLTAVPDIKSYNTLTNQVNTLEFSWKISAIPEPITNYRPTGHVILDSRKIDSLDLLDIENILYGADVRCFPLDGNDDLSEFVDGDDTTPPIVDGNDLECLPASSPRLPTPDELITLILT